MIYEKGKSKVIVECKGNNIFSPEEISSKQDERVCWSLLIGKKAENTIITVPTYLHYVQYQATKDAGTITDLNILDTKVLNQDTKYQDTIAAAIVYGPDLKTTTTARMKLWKRKRYWSWTEVVAHLMYLS